MIELKKEIKIDIPRVEQAPPVDFYIDKRCCEERYPSPRFPSPTSCLPLETLEDVRREIAAANELLLDLALEEDRTPDDVFHGAFRGLQGLLVDITTKTGVGLKGKVHTVGFDFVVVVNEKKEHILPYREVTKIKPVGRFAASTHEAQLSDIDAHFRRAITFSFGEIVASSPTLLNLFFGMRFNIYLLLLEARKINVCLDDVVIEGLVTDVNGETIVVKEAKELQVISMDKITRIEVLGDSQKVE